MTSVAINNTASFVCDLCFYDCETLYDSQGFKNTKNVCESCRFYVEYHHKYPAFSLAIDDIIPAARDAIDTGLFRFPCLNPDNPVEWFFIRFPREYDYDCEKYDLLYRCRIVVFMKCMTLYSVSPSFNIGNDIMFDTASPRSKDTLLETVCSAFNASLFKLPQAGAFIMTPEGDFKKEMNIAFPGAGDHRVGIRMLHGHSGTKELLGFDVYGWGKKPARTTNQFPETYNINKYVRCESISFDETTLEWTDPVSEQCRKEHAIKEAKKEKERKEQEKQQKKQRQREQQRQLDLERKAEQDALRQARATLVDAVAKIDEELEKIRKLRELNREVALTNKKIFERKETEKLAKEAERRHAEKLKQKELERQRFISKKL